MQWPETFLTGFRAVRVSVLVFISVLFALGLEAVGEDEQKTHLVLEKVALRDRVATYLDWFPADTESVVVAQGPFKVPKALPIEGNNASVEQLFRAIALSPLAWINRERYLAPISGLTIVTSVEGIKGFRGDPDRVHKEYEYSGCHVLVFEKTLGEAGDDLWKMLLKDASSQMTLEGLEVLVVATTEEKPFPKRLLIVMPRANILLCATEERMLKEILERMVNNRKSNALPATLLEWKQIDTKARCWALRHFSRENAPNDPSSFLTNDPTTGTPFDPDAFGAVMSLDADSKNVARFCCLSGNVEFANRSLKRMSRTFQRLGIQSVEVTFRNFPEISADVSAPEHARLFLGVILSMWAHQGWL